MFSELLVQSLKQPKKDISNYTTSDDYGARACRVYLLHFGEQKQHCHERLGLEQEVLSKDQMKR